MDPEVLEELARLRAEIDSLDADITPNPLAREVQEALEQLDAPEPLGRDDPDTGFIGEIGRGFLQGLSSGLQGISVLGKRLEGAMGIDNLDLDDRLLFNLGTKINEYVEENFAPETPESRTFLGDTLPNAIGSMLSMFVNPIGAPFVSVGGGFQEARASGLLEEEAIRAGATPENVIAGAIELLPIGRALKRGGKLAKGAGEGLLMGASKGAGEEAVQEVVQSALENASAQRTFDPERGLLSGAGEAGAAGGVVGFVMNATMGALGLRMRGRLSPEQAARVAADLPPGQAETFLRGATMPQAPEGVDTGAFPQEAESITGEVEEQQFEPGVTEEEAVSQAGVEGVRFGEEVLSPVPETNVFVPKRQAEEFGFESEQEFVDYALNESEDPGDVVYAMSMAPQLGEGTVESSILGILQKEDVFFGFERGGVLEELNTDRRAVPAKFRRRGARNEGTISLEDLTIQVSEDLGREVSIEEVREAAREIATRDASPKQQYDEATGADVVARLRRKFKDLTGKAATDENIREAVGQEAEPPGQLFREAELEGNVDTQDIEGLRGGEQVREEVGGPVQEQGPSPQEAEANTLPPEEESVGVRFKDIAEIRGVDVSELGDQQKVEFQQALDRANETGLIDRIGSVVTDVMVNPRALSPEETAAFAAVRGRLIERIDEKSFELQDLRRSQNVADKVKAQTVLAEKEALEAEQRALDDALEVTGSFTGRSLSFRNIRTTGEYYSVATTLKRAEENKGAPLTNEERAAFTDRAREISKARERLREEQAFEEATKAEKRRDAKKALASLKKTEDQFEKLLQCLRSA